MKMPLLTERRFSGLLDREYKQIISYIPSWANVRDSAYVNKYINRKYHYFYFKIFLKICNTYININYLNIILVLIRSIKYNLKNVMCYYNMKYHDFYFFFFFLINQQ